MKSLLFFLCFFLNYSIKAQSFININLNEKPVPYEHNIDMIHTIIEPTFDLKNGKVIGKVTHQFKAIRPEVEVVFLNGDKMVYKEILQNTSKCRFNPTDSGVYITLNKKIKWNETTIISIKYECAPKKGLYFIGWNDTTNRARTQLWTQGEGEDNRAWIPMYDKPNDKYTTEMILDFDAKYKVLSNGTLLECKTGVTSTHWHYKMLHPHAGYLVMLGVGEYEIEKRKTKRGVDVNLYYYPDSKNTLMPSYRYSTECIDFLEDETNVPFPWENYSNIPVQDFMYGAMENTTATIFGDFYLTDARAANDRNYINTNVHELTHQWFGDLITNRNWDHIWLQESFATYYPKIFQRKVYGEDQYQWMRRQEQNGALSAGARNNLPIVHLNSGTERVYSKGSTVIDMLNYVFGEEVYKKVITHYLLKHKYANVETSDLIQAYQDVAGISPQWFFDQWVYKGGEPSYAVIRNDFKVGVQSKTSLTITQNQLLSSEVGLFKMPIVTEFYYRSGAIMRDTIWVANQSESFYFDTKTNDTVEFILVDPGSYITKKIKFEKSPKALLAQASTAASMIDRFDAWIGLQSYEGEDKKALLIKRYRAENHQAILSEIVQQMPKEMKDLIAEAMTNKHTEVRAAALSQAIKNKELFTYKQIATMLYDSSYNNIQIALEYLCANDTANIATYLGATKDYKSIGLKLHIKWLELELNRAPNTVFYLNELIDYTSPSYEFQTRRNAAEALKRLNICNVAIAANLTEAATSFNTRLSGPVKEVIKYFAQQSNYKRMLLKYWNENQSNSKLKSTIVELKKI